MGLIAAGYLLALIVVVRLIARLSGSPLKWYFDPMVLFSSLWIFGYLVYSSPIFIVRDLQRLYAFEFTTPIVAGTRARIVRRAAAVPLPNG